MNNQRSFLVSRYDFDILIELLRSKEDLSINEYSQEFFEILLENVIHFGYSEAETEHVISTSTELYEGVRRFLLTEKEGKKFELESLRIQALVTSVSPSLVRMLKEDIENIDYLLEKIFIPLIPKVE